MKFTIVTPSFNRHDFLDETIKSVVSQQGEFEIEYIIQDGGSNEKVIRILESWDRKISAGDFIPACRKLDFKFYVEPDTGMYDAINKGFSKGTGEICAWINSDDTYFPSAFAAIHQAFMLNKHVNWIIGKSVKYNSLGNVTFVSNYPNSYSREFIKRGYYRNVLYKLTWLSQDSIFWRRSLWNSAGPLCTQHRLISDFRLWQSFAAHSELTKIETLIAGYRSHTNQLTSDPGAYANELNELVLPRISSALYLACSFFKAFPFFRHSVQNTFVSRLLALLISVQPDSFQGEKLTWDDKTEKWVLSKQNIFL